ncbi:MAG TPA: DUF6491 family protein [Candidatus Binatia bacterium]|nr:DUF6491 family protein [Candidatus Binatia bacterium]
MRRLTVLAICAALAIGGAVSASHAEDQQASAATSDGDDCFRAFNVRRYAVIDDHTVRVRVSPRRSYTLTTSENAADLDWGRNLSLSSDTGWVCVGDVRGAVYITGGDMGNRYGIDTVVRDPHPPPEADADSAGEAG